MKLRASSRSALSAVSALAVIASPIAALAEDAVPSAEAQAEVTPEQTDVPRTEPVDDDERGLWMQMDEYERDLRTSPAVIRDEALNDYVRSVLCRTVGEDRCANVRIYLVRTPYFNASMAPNGMMQVWSGLLLRTQNEAQLAAVLGHEYAHFNQQHSLKLFRDIKDKSAAAFWLGFIPFGSIASLGLMSSIFSFSRDMEREADDHGLQFIADAGYDTRESYVIWERLRAEMDATAEARNTKSRKDKNGGMFATHPPTAERVENLKEASSRLPGVPDATGSDRYRAALAAFWPEFLDDQLKLNDFGASEFLLSSLADHGWTPQLLFARGELYRRRGNPEDLAKSVEFFSEAVAGGGDIAEIWRGRGLARIKLGQADAGQADLAEYLRRAPDAADRAMIAMLAGEVE